MTQVNNMRSNQQVKSRGLGSVDSVIKFCFVLWYRLALNLARICPGQSEFDNLYI